MKIRFRLLLLIISVIVISKILSFFLLTYLTKDALENAAKEKLSAVLEARHNSLTRHLDVLARQMKILSSSSATVQLLEGLSEGFAEFGKDAQTILQQNYLAEKRDPKQLEHLPLLETRYGKMYKKTSAFFLRRYRVYGWTDILLIDKKGNVVFSVLREGDFATNLVSGIWKDTGLAKAVVPLLSNPVPETLSFSDFSNYGPSGNEPAVFVAIPIFDPDKESFSGVVAIQMPVSQINDLMKDKTGLGETGESFVVGKGGWMLSDSRFEKESTILKKQLKTEPVRRVLSGEMALLDAIDYRQKEIYVTFKPIYPFEGTAGEKTVWGIIAKVDKSEVLQSYYKLRIYLLILIVALVALSIGGAIIGANTITRPLFQIKDALIKLSNGEHAFVPGLNRNDEIGEMAKAAEKFRLMSKQVEYDHWLSENVAALANIISNAATVEIAADGILSFLCRKMNVPVGAIYLLENEKFRRIGTHGLALRNQTNDYFEIGSGILGQCAKDGREVVISPVPTGTLIIETGLAEFSPNELILYPISLQQEVFAVLELATSKPLESKMYDFLKSVSNALGIHLANLQSAEYNTALLKETRLQSEALKEKQISLTRTNEEMVTLTEELRSQSEEMRSQNEELKINQEELRAQQEETQRKNQLLESQSNQLEEAFRDSERKASDLTMANRYKSEFLANMSHELRTPLNSILILSKNLAENQGKNLTEEDIESAKVISESGNQLLTLINDILDLSKIESGKLELDFQHFSMKEVVSYLVRVFTPQAEKKGISFTANIASDMPETILSDRQRLTQVLTNLLSNAIKFTESGTVQLQVSKEKASLLFEVMDTGIGIPPNKLDHIFGVFQQLDGSTSRKYGGSGLGLAITKHLVEILGGEIILASQLGKGSRFLIRIPDKANPSIEDTESNIPTESHITIEREEEQSTLGEILIIEDDARLLSILGRMVKTLGYSPILVESAEHALVAISQNNLSGILLDLGLPKMSGMEFLKELKSKEATSQIPVFIMSGTEDKGEAKTLGALGFLKKPITREKLSESLKAMVRNENQTNVKELLLIEDNPIDIQAIERLFKNDSVHIVCARTGKEAMKLLESRRFDSVILDFKLPDMTGLDWLKLACNKLNPPPTIVYSARDLTEEEVFQMKEVAETIVTKGAGEERLYQEVLRTLKDTRISENRYTKNSSSGKKLLIVDDDARNLFALTRVLRSRGYSVEVASSGKNALELVAKFDFDAVLTDIMMPEMDGYELIRQLRNRGMTKTPILAVTAKAMQGDEELCIKAGATGYLTKPVDIQSLMDWLKDI